jgi:large subunit ribosomal protein L19
MTPAESVSDIDQIEPGMVVRVHQKIKETTPKGDERERIQVFEGTVIAKKGKDSNSATITVRKIASGVGVERIFPLRLPTIAKIEAVKRLKTRRAKLYYLRTYKKRLKEKTESA